MTVDRDRDRDRRGVEVSPPPPQTIPYGSLAVGSCLVIPCYRAVHLTFTVPTSHETTSTSHDPRARARARPPKCDSIGVELLVRERTEDGKHVCAHLVVGVRVRVRVRRRSSLVGVRRGPWFVGRGS